MWFAIEWDLKSEGTYSEVQGRRLVGDPNPNVGDHVQVKVRKHKYGGVIRKKGMYVNSQSIMSISMSSVGRSSC